MAAQILSIDGFLEKSLHHPIIDVRSPSEYMHAHIPGAHSLPLFDDEERKMVGTTYKQQSRKQAIKVGVDFFGPKMRYIIETAEQLMNNQEDKTILVHCWRGGMRSGAVAWLLDLYGFKVFTLKGGYKAFRNYVLEILAAPHSLRILSGETGSGKTDILTVLKEKGENVIDLEALAGHKGSAFGNLGLPPQKSAEFFENKLALKLAEIQNSGNKQPIWLESESNRIGNINIQHTFFNQMKIAPCVHINVPAAERLNKIEKEYGVFEVEELKNAVLRIQKRLGGLETKTAITFLEEGNIKAAFSILLKYYDKFYTKSTIFKEPFIEINLPNTDAVKNGAIILEKINQHQQ